MRPILVGVLALSFGALAGGGLGSNSKRPGLESKQGAPSVLSVLSPPGAGYDATNVALTTGSGAAVTVTRASTQTCGQPGQTLTSVANDKPCVDQGRLLVEPAATNGLVRSGELDNASWLVNAGTPTRTANTWDFGLGSIGETLDDNDAGSVESITQVFTTAVNGVYTFSCYAQSGTNTKLRLEVVATGGGTGSNICQFSDLTTATQRKTCSVTASGAHTGVGVTIGVSSTAGDTGAVLVGGCQLETGSVATSYIPTAGATASRVAGVQTVTTPSTLSRTEFATKVCVTPQWTGAAPPMTQLLLDGDDGAAARFGYLTTTGYAASDGAAVEVAVTWTNSRRCFRTSGSATRNVLRVEDLTAGTSNTKAFTTMGAYDADIGIGYSRASGAAQANALLDSICFSSNPDGCR